MLPCCLYVISLMLGAPSYNGRAMISETDHDGTLDGLALTIF